MSSQGRIEHRETRRCLMLIENERLTGRREHNKEGRRGVVRMSSNGQRRKYYLTIIATGTSILLNQLKTLMKYDATLDSLSSQE